MEAESRQNSGEKIARLQMPEGGLLNFRIPPEIKEPDIGDYFVGILDYGQDVGRVVSISQMNTTEERPAFTLAHPVGPNERHQLADNQEQAAHAQEIFEKSVHYEKTHVRILHARFSFGGERLFIRYSASAPTDLRRFVSQLQRNYHTVVDLWQVGVRDEASFTGCTGVCGRAACCCTWQRQFDNLNLKLARDQDLPLNGAMLNGTCGRLKCCLAFEHEQYCQAAVGLPEVGSLIRAEGDPPEEGTLISRDILRGILTFRTEDGRFVSAPRAQIKTLRAAPPPAPDTYHSLPNS